MNTIYLILAAGESLRFRAAGFAKSNLLLELLRGLAPHETGFTDTVALLIERGGDVRALATSELTDWSTPEALEASGAGIVSTKESRPKYFPRPT